MGNFIGKLFLVLGIVGFIFCMYVLIRDALNFGELALFMIAVVVCKFLCDNYNEKHKK